MSFISQIICLSCNLGQTPIVKKSCTECWAMLVEILLQCVDFFNFEFKQSYTPLFNCVCLSFVNANLKDTTCGKAKYLLQNPSESDKCY